MELLAKKIRNNLNAHDVIFEFCQQLESTNLNKEETPWLYPCESAAHMNDSLGSEDPDFDLFDALVNCVEESPADAEDVDAMINRTKPLPNTRL